MTLSFCSFSSGSSGNSYLIKTEDTALLVDAGISAKRILDGLAQTETEPDLVKALLITHEHSDHTKSVKTVLKKIPGLSAFANQNTWSGIHAEIPEERKKSFSTGDRIEFGEIGVKTFRVSHDAADPVGFSFYAYGKQISIVTDTGCVTDDLFEEILDADLLVLEANHDVEMLKFGRYPWPLKQRILGERGHLSNEAAGELLVKLLSENSKERNVLLAHLSRENNFPEMAQQTVKNILEEAHYYIGREIRLNTIVRDQVSCVFQV